jgi:predicted anti-sigma-YlaC factor YlaD
MIEMDYKALFAEYAFPAIVAIILLAFLPQYLNGIMGVFGSFTGYAVSFVVLVLSIWVTKKTRRYIDAA